MRIIILDLVRSDKRQLAYACMVLDICIKVLTLLDTTLMLAYENTARQKWVHYDVHIINMI